MSALKRNNVIVQGQGEKAMVFAHGYGCDQNMWRFITPAFQDRYRTVLFDHVGAGQSGNMARSQLVVLKATGHCPNLSAPQETIAAMKSYLQALG